MGLELGPGPEVRVTACPGNNYPHACLDDWGRVPSTEAMYPGASVSELAPWDPFFVGDLSAVKSGSFAAHALLICCGRLFSVSFFRDSENEREAVDSN